MADESTSTSSTRAKKPVRPRAGIQRRTQAEREEFRRKEAEREAERTVVETAPASKPATRGSRGASRGTRGGVSVHKTERTQGAATGIFGAGAVFKPERSKAPVDLGVSEALDGSDVAKLTSDSNALSTALNIETGSDSRGRGTAAGVRGSARKNDEENIPISDDDQDDRPRRDIERIWISSDEDDEGDEDAIVSRKGKQRYVSRVPKASFGLRPVRAARQPSDQLDDEDLSRANTATKGDNGNAAIDIDTDEMIVDVAPTTIRKDRPSSPELSKKPSKKLENRVKEAKILVETAEEKAERLRMDGDIDKLRMQFLTSHDVTDDSQMDDNGEETNSLHTGHERMFLLQLPPLVPQLFDPLTRLPANIECNTLDNSQGVQVKTEADGSNTAVNPEKEEDKDKDKEKTEPPLTVFTSASALSERFPQGFVGKLNVHKSGKVTLDWGGTDMEVRHGTEVDFLQDVICVESHELPELTDVENQEQIGKAYSLGQVEKKMVLVPDWTRLYA